MNLYLACFYSPFDVEDLTLSSGNVSKATALQRRVSVYSQGTPETPTFQDTSFFVSALVELFSVQLLLSKTSTLYDSFKKKEIVYFKRIYLGVI